MKYTKKSPRLIVKYINADTEETLIELKDRNWMNVGDSLTENTLTLLMEQEFKNKPAPRNIMVIAVGEFKLTES